MLLEASKTTCIRARDKNTLMRLKSSQFAWPLAPPCCHTPQPITIASYSCPCNPSTVSTVTLFERFQGLRSFAAAVFSCSGLHGRHSNGHQECYALQIFCEPLDQRVMQSLGHHQLRCRLPKGWRCGPVVLAGTPVTTWMMPMSLLQREWRRGLVLEPAGTLEMTRKMLLLVKARKH